MVSLQAVKRQIKDLALDVREIWHEYKDAGKFSEYGMQTREENQRFREEFQYIVPEYSSGLLSMDTPLNNDKILKRLNLIKRTYHTFF